MIGLKAMIIGTARSNEREIFIMADETKNEECGLICCLLMDNSNLGKVYDYLKPEMFTNKLAGQTYSVLLKLFYKNIPLEFPTIVGELESYEYPRGLIDLFLRNCLEKSLVSTNCLAYADEIYKAYKARTIKSYIDNSSFLAKDIDATIDGFMSVVDKFDTSQQFEMHSVKQIAEKYKEFYFKNKKIIQMKTGFAQLDSMCFLEGGDICVIGARPSVGKSCFSMQIMCNIAKQGFKVGYYNLEMSDKQLFERFIAQNSNLPLSRIKNATCFLNDEEQQYNNAIQMFSDLPIDIFTGSINLMKLKQTSKHFKHDLIIIDYLQLIKGDRKRDTRAAEVGDISKSLKEIARDLNVPVIVLSQLNRLSETKADKMPTMAELRESGDIEQDASIIILMWNMDEAKLYKGMTIDKNRQGATNRLAYSFNGPRLTFSEFNKSFSEISKIVKKTSGFESANDAPWVKDRKGE